MTKGSCHCGAVTFELHEKPEFLLECNCSICRRLSTHWAYSQKIGITLNAPEGSTHAYVWGDKELAFHSCKVCGCTTHWAAVDGSRFAVNCKLADAGSLSDIPIRHFDGADSWAFLD